MKRIAVIGAGTMGNGIAHVFAQNHFLVHLIDTETTVLEKAIQNIKKNLDRQVNKGTITSKMKDAAIHNITTFTDLKEGIEKADLIIEATTENKEIKKMIFAQMSLFAKKDSILATNTSSISITELASVTTRPEQVIGMHFMNPVLVMKLVEVIQSNVTAPSITKKIIALTEQLGKIPCLVNDAPGFIANRILMPMINEAIIALSDGVSDASTIDQIMKLGMAHPMGPLQLADYIGLDVCKNILDIMQTGFNNTKYAPAHLLVQKVKEGKLGIKTGEGFYKYE